jgi:hypothetical protein
MAEQKALTVEEDLLTLPRWIIEGYQIGCSLQLAATAAAILLAALSFPTWRGR